MARPRIIYRGAFPGFWFGTAVAALCGFGLYWIELSRERSALEAIMLGLLVFLAMQAFLYLLGFIATRKAVAVLATDDITLTGWRAGASGRGARFAIPIAEVEKWRWFDAHKGRNVVAVLEFTHRGDVYRISPYGARQLDVDAFRKLTPMVVSDAVTQSSASLIGRK